MKLKSNLYQSSVIDLSPRNDIDNVSVGKEEADLWRTYPASQNLTARAPHELLRKFNLVGRTENFKTLTCYVCPAENLYPVRQLHYFAGLEGVNLAVGNLDLHPGSRFPIGKYLKRNID